MKDDKENEQIVIQKMINEAMKNEFDELLRNNKNDTLLQLVIKNEVQDISIEELKKILSEE